MNKENINKVANKFEQKYGSEDLLKLCVSTLNRVLVEKNICTEDELFNIFLQEVERGIKQLSKKDVPLNPH